MLNKQQASGEQLDLNVSWRIGEMPFKHICQIIAVNDYSRLVEFGSGASTVRWALEFSHLNVLAFEHDQIYYAETMKLVQHFGVEKRAQVVYSPLSATWIGGRRFVSYTHPVVSESCDIAIIDGPPGFTRRGREACLYFVYDALSVGGTVVLDDANRQDERAVVENWLKVYPGSFQYSSESIGHGLAVLRKIRHVTAQRFSVWLLWDFMRVSAQQLRLAAGRTWWRTEE